MRNFKLITILTLPITPLAELFEKYVFGDWEFVKFLVVLICLDTALGFIKHWMSHDISSRAFGMIAKKLLIYSVIMMLSHVLASFAIAGEPVESFVWFRYFACSALMVREAISIIENSEDIMPGIVPAGILRRLKGFDNITGQKITKNGKEERNARHEEQ